MAEDANVAEDRRQEARLRRMAAAMGLVLRKSRTHDRSRMDYACFRIESKDGRPVSGTYPYPYSLSLQGVEEALELLELSPPGSAGAADAKWER
jgi:hypothetical protein